MRFGHRISGNAPLLGEMLLKMAAEMLTKAQNPSLLIVSSDTHFLQAESTEDAVLVASFDREAASFDRSTTAAYHSRRSVLFASAISSILLFPLKLIPRQFRITQ